MAHPSAGAPTAVHPGPPAEELRLIEALRRGDEAAFVALVERYHATLLRLARVYVGDPAVAEDVVQETWQGVLRGLDRFEGRSSLKTWLFRILTNRAKTRGEREARSVPFSSVWADDESDGDPESDRFRAPDDPVQPGGWASPPRSWGDAPEDRLLADEVRSHIDAAIAALPPAQRAVITLRDVEGWSSDEVRNVLELSETNQRVLLHRARAKVRRALEQYFEGGDA